MKTWTKELELELVNECVNMYSKGCTKTQIEDYVKQKSGTTSPHRISYINGRVYDEIKKQAISERNRLIGLHIARYEDIFDRNFSIDATHKKFETELYRKNPWLVKQALLDHYYISMESLRAKENILGLHLKSFNIQLNKFYKDQSKNLRFDYSKLSFKDQILLKNLIKKMRKKDNLIQEIPIETQAIIINDEDKVSSKNVIETNQTASDKIKEVINVEKPFEEKVKNIHEVQKKIVKEDIKQYDPARKDMLEKLKKLGNKKK